MRLRVNNFYVTKRQITLQITSNKLRWTVEKKSTALKLDLEARRRFWYSVEAMMVVNFDFIFGILTVLLAFYGVAYFRAAVGVNQYLIWLPHGNVGLCFWWILIEGMFFQGMMLFYLTMLFIFAE